MRNFGHDGPGKFNGVGINGKNSELHAAVGLVVLRFADRIRNRRRNQVEFYNKSLSLLECKFQVIQESCIPNYSYYPLIFDSEATNNAYINNLAKQNIFARRYFFPALNDLEYINKNQSLPVAQHVSKSILCLPLYHNLTKEMQTLITRNMLRTQNYSL